VHGGVALGYIQCEFRIGRIILRTLGLKGSGYFANIEGLMGKITKTVVPLQRVDDRAFGQFRQR